MVRNKLHSIYSFDYFIITDFNQSTFSAALTVSQEPMKYRENGKEIIILGRGRRMAKEIKQFAGANFRDFEYLRERLKMQ